MIGADKRAAGAAGTAGTAGSRADRPESEQRRDSAAGELLREKRGKSAGELREDSSILGVPADLQPLPPTAPAPSLVPVSSLKMPREVAPAEAPEAPGDQTAMPRAAEARTRAGAG
jgi:hypothetical protein